MNGNSRSQTMPSLLLVIFFFALFLIPSQTRADAPPSDEELALQLADMELESLISMTVTSVSRKEQSVADAPAAVFVISNEDIRRSGATSIPEALRMAPGLQVARIDSNIWAISARGFNGQFANKLLVLIDGRTVYTPLFSGVFWDAQDTLLEDVERIEVIRGPGATLWGANAVNGVINIITKNANSTQGGLIAGGGGNQERLFGQARYGGMIGDKTAYRVYGKYNDRADNELVSGGEAHDGWQGARGGFRTDIDSGERDAFRVHGDGYYLDEHANVTAPILEPPFSELLSGGRHQSGANVVGAWTREFSEESEMQLQAYYDYISRDDFILEQQRHTADIDFQHRFLAGERHDIVWGFGYRFYRDRIQNTDVVALDPDRRSFNLATTFIQDDIEIIADRLNVIVGSKFEYNDFTGFEYQPSVKALGKPTDNQTVWGSVSRAVRTPSRVNNDVLLSVSAFPTDTGLPGQSVLLGNSDVESEDLLSFELGYRADVADEVSVDIATYYNFYDNLLTFEPGPPTPRLDLVPPRIIVPLNTRNLMRGETYGVELVTDYRPVDWWRFVGTYTFLHMKLKPKSGSMDTIASGAEGDDPKHQFYLRSLLDLPHDVEFDAAFRFVSKLETLNVDEYFELDLRLGWSPIEDVQLEVVGQNLLEGSHQEFAPTFISSEVVAIKRGVYGKVTLEF